jgi:hypothetical protein
MAAAAEASSGIRDEQQGLQVAERKGMAQRLMVFRPLTSQLPISSILVTANPVGRASAVNRRETAPSLCAHRPPPLQVDPEHRLTA